MKCDAGAEYAEAIFRVDGVRPDLSQPSGCFGG